MINVFSCQKVRHFVPSDRSLWHGVLGSDVRHSNVHSAGVQCLQCWVVLFCSLGRETAAASATAWERGICEGCRGASGCSQPCLMVTPSGNMGALGTLWMYLRWFRYGDGVCSPWGSSGSGRKELVEKPFLLRRMRGNTFLVLLKDLQRNQLVRELWPTQVHSCCVCHPSIPFPIFLGILLYYNTESEPVGENTCCTPEQLAWNSPLLTVLAKIQAWIPSV